MMYDEVIYQAVCVGVEETDHKLSVFISFLLIYKVI